MPSAHKIPPSGGISMFNSSVQGHTFLNIRANKAVSVAYCKLKTGKVIDTE